MRRRGRGTGGRDIAISLSRSHEPDPTSPFRRARSHELYLPFPRPGIGFWNTNLLDSWPGFQAVLSGVLLLLVGWVLRRRPAALAFWLAATFGTLAFLYLKYFGYLRHHGHLFLALRTRGPSPRRQPPRTGGNSPGGV